jgi:hypothetical protein
VHSKFAQFLSVVVIIIYHCCTQRRIECVWIVSLRAIVSLRLVKIEDLSISVRRTGTQLPFISHSRNSPWTMTNRSMRSQSWKKTADRNAQRYVSPCDLVYICQQLAAMSFMELTVPCPSECTVSPELVLDRV